MEDITITERHCMNPKCDKVIGHGKKKYCSELCRSRDSAMRQYNKNRNDDGFKEKRKAKNKRYYEANKEDLKAKMRIYGMQYYFKKRDETKKIQEQVKKEETNNEEGDQGKVINQTFNN